MKIILKILCGFLWLALHCLYPVLMIFSLLSNTVLTFLGGGVILVAILDMLLFKGVNSDSISICIVGSVLMLLSQLMTVVMALYQTILEKLREFIFGVSIDSENW